MIDVEKIECCANCKYCKTLYVPPSDEFTEVRQAVKGTKSAYVCSAYIEQSGEVQYLGDNNGMCEVFTERGE